MNQLPAITDRYLWPADVSKLTGASINPTISNWRYHGYLDGIGKYDNAGACWCYSILDAIKVRIISDLAVVGMRLPFAAAIANVADERIVELGDNKPFENQIIVAWVEGDQLTVRRARADAWLAEFNRRSQPTIVVPIDVLAAEMIQTVAKWRVAVNTGRERRRAEKPKKKAKVRVEA